MKNHNNREIKSKEAIKKFIKKKTYPPKITFFRIFKAIWRQKSKTPNCPSLPRLDGKLALVTGGNHGIGFETTKGLVKRGAEVIILTRSESKSKDAIEKIKAEVNGKVHFICLDLSDIKSILTATKKIAIEFPKQKVTLPPKTGPVIMLVLDHK